MSLAYSPFNNDYYKIPDRVDICIDPDRHYLGYIWTS